MSAASSQFDLQTHDAAGLLAQRSAVLAVYTEVYAERMDDPFFAPERFWERLEAYSARDGFSLVTARIASQLIGYTLGYTLPRETRWWQGFRGDVNSDVLREDGHRTFAINELSVLPSHRRRGHAHALHNALLADRSEERATLLVRPANIPARTAYLKWGWYVLGELQPFDDSPVYEALMRKL